MQDTIFQQLKTTAQTDDHEITCEARGQVSVITSVQPSSLGKTFSIDATGVKVQVQAQITQAQLQVRPFSNAQEFADLLNGLTTAQAICASVPKLGQQSVGLVTKAALEVHPAAIARTKEHLDFPLGPGVMTIDYDPKSRPLQKDELIAALTKACPDVVNAMKVWWVSSSSNVFFNESKIRGISGQRLYVLVKNARDIPRAGSVLQQRLWMAGFGWIMVSRSGQRLERTIADAAMFEAARIDFAGGAVCVPPLEQRRGPPEVLQGHSWLDTETALADLSTSELAHCQALIQSAKTAVDEQCIEMRQAWINARLKHLTAKLELSGIPTETAASQASQTLKHALGGHLTDHFLIPLTSGEFVSVAEVLADPQRWDGCLTLDPLEPEYGDGRPVGKLLLRGREPKLHSMAHGGQTYLLSTKPNVHYHDGRLADFVQKICLVLSRRPDFFLVGGQLVKTTDFGYALVTRASLPTYASQTMNLTKGNVTRNKVQPMDLNATLADNVLSVVGDFNFRTLTDVASISSIDPSGRIVDKSGYDEASGVYFQLPEDTPQLDKNRLDDKAYLASCLEIMFRPWAQYPFATKDDLAAMIAAILTAVARPMLKIRPGFYFNAPKFGSGKSFAAFALGALIQGNAKRGMTTLKNSESEISKEILSVLISGEQVLILDNAKGFIESPNLEACVTSESFSGRLLGKTSWANCSNRIFLCITANNGTLSADLRRRMCSVRIDSNLENPHVRSFASTPAELVLRNRQEIARCAVALMAASMQATDQCSPPDDCGFPEWNQLVRNTVLWLESSGIGKMAGLPPIGDPAASMFSNAGCADPTEISKAGLLEGLAMYLEDQEFKAADLLKVIRDEELTRSDICRDSSSAICVISDAVRSLTKQNNGQITAASIGLALSNMRDTPMNGLVLRAARLDRNKSTIWCVCAHRENERS